MEKPKKQLNVLPSTHSPFQEKTILVLVVKNLLDFWYCFINSLAIVVSCELKILYRSPCKLFNLLRFKDFLQKKFTPL